MPSSTCAMQSFSARLAALLNVSRPLFSKGGCELDFAVLSHGATHTRASMAPSWSACLCKTNSTLASLMTCCDEGAPLIQDKDAGASTVAHGNQIAASLRKITDPFFLRREKSSISFTTVADAAQQESETGADGKAPAAGGLTAKKQDFIVWLSLHPFQRQLYTVCPPCCIRICGPCVSLSVTSHATCGHILTS